LTTTFDRREGALVKSARDEAELLWIAVAGLLAAPGPSWLNRTGKTGSWKDLRFRIFPPERRLRDRYRRVGNAKSYFWFLFR
jgi:hypothetical protein